MVSSHLLLLTVCLVSVSEYLDSCGASVYLQDHMTKKGMRNVSLWSTESTKSAWVFPLVLRWLSVTPSKQEGSSQDLISCCEPPIIHQRVPTRDPSGWSMLGASIRVRQGSSPATCHQRSEWGCPDPTGTRPPGFLRPRAFGGPGFGVVAVGWSYQSQSSRLGPGLKRRARTAKNSQPPGEKQGKSSSLWVMVCFVPEKTMIRPRQERISQHVKNRFLTSCVLKNRDVSRALRSSSSLCR